MKKTDWLGKWFDIYEEMGEYGQSAYAVEDEHGTLEFIFLPHQYYDGMGGLRHLIRERSGLEIDVPTVNGWGGASFFKLIKALVHNVILHRNIQPKWAVPRSEAHGKQQNPTLLRFTNEETASIVKTAKTGNISVNTFLLYICDRVVEGLMWEKHAARWWMLPVNLRGVLKKEGGIHTSYVIAVIRDESSPQALNDSIQRSLRQQWHRATYILSNIGKLVGISGIRSIVRNQYKSGFGWTGYFSNLGVISHDFPSLAKETWYGCAPVNRLIPISIGAMTFNGRLTLAFLIHPSIDPDGAYALKLRDAIKSDILNRIK